MATLSRIPALPDEGPRAKGNPLSTRFYLRGPMHQQMWSWVHGGECAWDRPFEVYPQPPHRPCGDINSFQRTMFRHLTINNDDNDCTVYASHCQQLKLYFARGGSGVRRRQQ